MSDSYIGQIMWFAGARPPGDGWIPCDGRALSTVNFEALHAVIGDTYGGDGLFFRVPDLRGAFAVGAGNGVKVGEASGAATVQLQAQHLPPHSHGLRAAAGPTGPTEAIQSARSPAPMSFHPTPISATGGTDPVATMPPYLTVYFYIASDGIFPPSAA